MRKILLGLPAFCLLMACGSSEQSAVITVSGKTLMHEVRATPSPANGACVKMNPPRFMWPDKFPHLGPVLDGVPGQVDEKPKVVYRIRISQDKNFQKEVLIGERAWAFFNPFQCLAQGKWYWQYAYVTPGGKEEWSPVYQFHIGKDTPEFNPPTLEKVLAKYTSHHPRVLLDADDWEEIITKNKNNPEAQAYMDKASRCISHPLKHLQEEIDTTNVVTLTNVVQRESALIRESRKIVDREEANVEALVRAYLLTKDKKYYREGINRLSEILIKVCKYLEISSDYLLDLNPEAPPTLTDQEQELLEHFRQCSPGEQDSILLLANAGAAKAEQEKESSISKNAG